jgi:acyl-CoA thioester hydrolase
MAFTAAPYIRRANYYETDKMGIIHHSNFIRWFEEARLDYMRKCGLNYEDMEKDGILVPVTDFNCKCKIPIRFDEITQIYTRLVSFNGVRVTYGYDVYISDGTKLAVTGESGHCFIDITTRRPLNLKKQYPRLYEKGIDLLK